MIAEFDFISVNNPISTTEVILETISDLSDYTPNMNVTLTGDLILGVINTSGRSITLNNSSIINTTSGLESIVSIDGDLIISNTEISDLSGLSNLIFIGGNLIIENNAMLFDYCGLSNLIANEGVIGDIIISNNLYNPMVSDILTDNCSDDSTLNLEGYNPKVSVSIYPNPASPVTAINFISSNSIEFIKLYNVNGKEIVIDYSLEKKVINIKEIHSGIYFLKFYTQKGLSYKKLVIK